MAMLVSCFAPMVARAGTETVNKFPAAFIGRMQDECLTAQAGQPLNKRLSSALIARYCECVSHCAGEVITMDDLFDDVAGKHEPLQLKLNALRMPQNAHSWPYSGSIIAAISPPTMALASKPNTHIGRDTPPRRSIRPVQVSRLLEAASIPFQAASIVRA